MTINIRNYLEDLEARLNVAEEQRLLGLWKDFVEHRSKDRIFSPVRQPTKPGKLYWPEVNVNDAILDSTFDIDLGSDQRKSLVVDLGSDQRKSLVVNKLTLKNGLF